MTIEKDLKGNTYIITTEDAEGYHKTINLTFKQLIELAHYGVREWINNKYKHHEEKSRQDLC